MSDYLSNLAARSVGLTPMIEPRPASLFEPLHRASGPTLRDDADPEVPDETATSPENGVGTLGSVRQEVHPRHQRHPESRLPAVDSDVPLDAPNQPMGVSTTHADFKVSMPTLGPRRGRVVQTEPSEQSEQDRPAPRLTPVGSGTGASHAQSIAQPESPSPIKVIMQAGQPAAIQSPGPPPSSRGGGSRT
jgi:hypothetical protein